MIREYQVCTRCIMDTTDSDIAFDENGVCNHCKQAESIGEKVWFPNEEGQRRLAQMIEQIKQEGKGKQYDAIIGLSGGVDSSYLAYKAATEWGLRLLAVHVDAGWNTEIAEENIRRICNNCNIDLKVIKIDWEDMKNLQIAFLKAAVPNQDIPQDHAFFANLYLYAIKNNIKYVLNGANWATESILPHSWGYINTDGKHIKDIYMRFGGNKLNSYKIVNYYKLNFYYIYLRNMKVVTPLNYIHYSKENAIKELSESLEWQYYGGKHYESIWTRFFQTYYLPNKFNFDKRKAHLSSLIVSRQITRNHALNEIKQDLYSLELVESDKKGIAKKLDISIDEFEKLLSINPMKHSDFFRVTDTKLYKIVVLFRNLKWLIKK